MSTILKVLAGVALMILGSAVARFGCVALMYGLYGGPIASIVLGIVGMAMLAGGVYLFVKGWDW